MHSAVECANSCDFEPLGPALSLGDHAAERGYVRPPERFRRRRQVMATDRPATWPLGVGRGCRAQDSVGVSGGGLLRFCSLLMIWLMRPRVSPLAWEMTS